MYCALFVFRIRAGGVSHPDFTEQQYIGNLGLMCEVFTEVSTRIQHLVLDIGTQVIFRQTT